MTEGEARATEAKPPQSNPTAGEVTLTLADIETGLLALPRARVAKYIAWGGAACVIALVAYRWIEGRDRTSLIVIGVVLLALLAWNRDPTKRIAKRVYDSLPEDARKLRVSASDEGFRVTSSGNETLLRWSEVRRFVETRSVLVVFVSQHDAQIIPKRAFSEGELGTIREWAKTKVVKHDEPWFTPQLRKRMMIWLVAFALVWTIWVYFGQR